MGIHETTILTGVYNFYVSLNLTYLDLTIPVSITCLMPCMVTDVSAMLVDTMTLRQPCDGAKHIDDSHMDHDI